MVGIKFIHTADIHLGSLLHIGEASYPLPWSRLLLPTMEGFSRVCHAAIKNRVDFVLYRGSTTGRPGPSGHELLRKSTGSWKKPASPYWS